MAIDKDAEAAIGALISTFVHRFKDHSGGPSLRMLGAGSYRADTIFQLAEALPANPTIVSPLPSFRPRGAGVGLSVHRCCSMILSIVLLPTVLVHLVARIYCAGQTGA